jgi:hypothetical protein
MSDAPNASTCETCPRHIWKHEVVMAAIAKGATAEHIEAFKSKLDLWYTSGEPVWMAADSLAFAAKEHAIQVRADREASFLRRRLVVSR